MWNAAQGPSKADGCGGTELCPPSSLPAFLFQLLQKVRVTYLSHHVIPMATGCDSRLTALQRDQGVQGERELTLSLSLKPLRSPAGRRREGKFPRKITLDNSTPTCNFLLLSGDLESSPGYNQGLLPRGQGHSSRKQRKLFLGGPTCCLASSRGHFGGPWITLSPEMNPQKGPDFDQSLMKALKQEWIKCLLCKHQDSSSVPKIHILKRPDGMAHSCIPSTRKMGAGRFLGLAGWLP